MRGDLDSQEVRKAMGKFLTGVTIACTRDENGAPQGITANSFTSVSLNPPIVLVCIAKASSTFDAFNRCDSFSVNVLSESQKRVSMVFASSAAERFEGICTTVASTGAPIVDGSLCWIDCRTVKRVEAGDHIVLFGHVEALDVGDGSPLGYWSGGYITLGLEAAASRVQGKPSAYVGCIVDFGGRVLLERDEHGKWRIPMAPLEGPRRNHEERIVRLLESLGLKGRPAFLYSVFEGPGEGTSYVFYRADPVDGARLADIVARGNHLRCFSQGKLPRERIWSREGLNMLDRYFRERAVGRFGIYSDAGLSGSVATLGSEPTYWDEAGDGRRGDQST